MLGERRGGSHGAAMLGLLWGLGHAITLIALGLPFVLWGDALPEQIRRVVEIAIGVLIAGLAVRLLMRWRRGYFHVHTHREALGRTPLAAFCIGLIHGIGGSAGAGILLVGTIEDRASAALALAVFAAATALAMGLATLGFGHMLSRGAVAARLQAAVPAFGSFGLLLGLWYALGSLDAVPYAL